ncbi:MAG: LytTR family DNA-binding domain-containing protein [Chloroherpetonaceae bacterium]
MTPSIRVIAVDDEPLALSKIQYLLSLDADFEIVAACSNGLEAIEAFQARRPDVLLLDVQMPVLSGFDVLDALREYRHESPFLIVLITAHDQYAVQAFNENAIDYLLKPFDAERFAMMLMKVKFQFRLKKFEHIPDHVLSRLLLAQNTYLEKFIVKKTGKTLVVDVKEVEWLKADGNYIELHCLDGSMHLVRQTIQDLEVRLNPSLFVRIHRGVIVGVHYIKSFHPTENNDYEITLQSGTSLALSRTYRKKVFHVLGKIS